MTSLNGADAIFDGGTPVDVIYSGDTEVWSAAAPPTAPLDFNGIYADATINKLLWGPPAAPSTAVSYELYYSVAGEILSPGEGVFVASIPLGEAAYTYDHTRVPAENDLPHWYSVFCLTDKGKQGEQATVMVEKELPGYAGSINATATSSTAITIFWTPPSPIGSAEGFRLLVKSGSYPSGPTDAAATVLVDDQPLTTLSYNHTGLTGSTTYYYTVYCTSDLGYGPGKNSQETTDRPPPPVPGAIPFIDGVTGWLAGVWWLNWKNPTNVATDCRYNIDQFRVHCQTNTTTPPGYGGVFKTYYTYCADGTSKMYLRFPPMDCSNPAAGSHAVSVYCRNVSGDGPPAGDYSYTGNQNPCGALVAMSEDVPLEDSEPKRRTMFADWTGMPFPDDEAQAWTVVEHRLDTVNDWSDDEGWWASLLLSIDVLSYRGGPSLDVIERGTGSWHVQSEDDARTTIDLLRERIPSLVMDRDLDGTYLAMLEAIEAWHSLGQQE